jgi:transposase-like protein
MNEFCGKEKLAILKEVETWQGSLSGIAFKYDINVSTLKEWRRRYELYGAEGLEFRVENKSYSVELKLQAVKDYLSGEYSQYEIIKMYNIASRTQLRDWIKKYNSHSGLRPYKNGGVAAMTKGRTTTWEERIDIVLYCLSQNRDYHKTAQKYQVSYQQVYQWVKKYDVGAEDALQDRRGRNKRTEELSEAERQKLAIKKLEAENERLRAENALLKKLEELERRRF